MLLLDGNSMFSVDHVIFILFPIFALWRTEINRLTTRGDTFIAIFQSSDCETAQPSSDYFATFIIHSNKVTNFFFI